MIERGTLTVDLRALFVKAVLGKWSEDRLMLCFPDNTVGEVKKEMIAIYNDGIKGTTLAQEFREYLDTMTITMEVEWN